MATTTVAALVASGCSKTERHPLSLNTNSMRVVAPESFPQGFPRDEDENRDDSYFYVPPTFRSTADIKAYFIKMKVVSDHYRVKANGNSLYFLVATPSNLRSTHIWGFVEDATGVVMFLHAAFAAVPSSSEMFRTDGHVVSMSFDQQPELTISLPKAPSKVRPIEGKTDPLQGTESPGISNWTKAVRFKQHDYRFVTSWLPSFEGTATLQCHEDGRQTDFLRMHLWDAAPSSAIDLKGNPGEMVLTVNGRAVLGLNPPH